MFAARRTPHRVCHGSAGTNAIRSRDEVVVPPRRQPRGTKVRRIPTLVRGAARAHTGTEPPSVCRSRPPRAPATVARARRSRGAGRAGQERPVPAPSDTPRPRTPSGTPRPRTAQGPARHHADRDSPSPPGVGPPGPRGTGCWSGPRVHTRRAPRHVTAAGSTRAFWMTRPGGPCRVDEWDDGLGELPRWLDAWFVENRADCRARGITVALLPRSADAPPRRLVRRPPPRCG